MTREDKSVSLEGMRSLTISSILVGTFLALAGCVPIWAIDDYRSSTSNDAVAEVPSSEPAQSDPGPSIPDGYVDFGIGIAGKYVDRDCSVSLYGCQWMEIYAYDDCSSMVYVEANVLDANGTVLGITNGTLGTLRSGQKGLIEFINLYDGGERLELTDASCF